MYPCDGKAEFPVVIAPSLQKISYWFQNFEWKCITSWNNKHMKNYTLHYIIIINNETTLKQALK